jgi:hypothetical protein
MSDLLEEVAEASRGARQRLMKRAGSLDSGLSENGVWAARCGDAEGNPRMCAATLLPQATTFLPGGFRRNASNYLRNASFKRLLSGRIYVCYLAGHACPRHSHRLSVGLIRAYDRAQAWVGGVPYPRRRGTVPAGEKTPSRPLNLKPGDLVQVRTYQEILATLDGNNKNRGLYFDAEEVPYCGQTFRVRSTVTKIIDEKTGRMLALKDRSMWMRHLSGRYRSADDLSPPSTPSGVAWRPAETRTA